MRIHSDTLTYPDLRDAARIAHVRLFGVAQNGSRSRARGWNVYASGSSPYRTQADRDEYAATWDEWGILIAELFRRDPSAIIGQYRTLSQFDAYTGGRFDALNWEDSHRLHWWNWDGARLACKCGASIDNGALR